MLVEPRPAEPTVAASPVPVVTLEQSYQRCRQLHRRHGTTYYWATRALPRIKQHHVHALYGLCRYADEIVDALDAPDVPEVAGDASVASRAQALGRLRAELAEGLRQHRSDHPVLKAVVHTAVAFDLGPDLFDRFLDAMARDLVDDAYETYDDLLVYMDGSAAVIGELMLPILEPVDPLAALPGARDLGIAFQLTNFLRDVGEDLDRGRVYLPQEDLRRFGADPWTRRVDEAWRELCRFEVARIRALYASADEGISHLPPRSAGGIRAARVLYGEILDRIEADDYDVFSRRARVPLPRKLAVAGQQLLRSRRA